MKHFSQDDQVWAHPAAAVTCTAVKADNRHQDADLPAAGVAITPALAGMSTVVPSLLNDT